MHSFLRWSQQKSLGDVTQTQEVTEHISFAHLDSKDEKRLIRNFLSGGATSLKLSSRHQFLHLASKIHWNMVVSLDNKTFKIALFSIRDISVQNSCAFKIDLFSNRDVSVNNRSLSSLDVLCCLQMTKTVSQMYSSQSVTEQFGVCAPDRQTTFTRTGHNAPWSTFLTADEKCGCCILVHWRCY